VQCSWSDVPCFAETEDVHEEQASSERQKRVLRFSVRQFEKHEVTKGHDWASERRSGHALTVAGLFKKQQEKQTKTANEHQDFSYWLATECLPDAKVVSFDRFQKARNKDFKADRVAVARHSNALCTILTEDQEVVMSDAIALALGIDDGSNKHSVKIKADTAKTHRGERPEMFMYALRRLEHDDLNAEGMLRKIKTLKIPFQKVFWFARDGASVMKKLSRLFREVVNPYTMDVWCSNHLGNCS